MAGNGRIVHLSFFDPAEATGSKDEILSVFRNVRYGRNLGESPCCAARRAFRKLGLR